MFIVGWLDKKQATRNQPVSKSLHKKETGLFFKNRVRGAGMLNGINFLAVSVAAATSLVLTFFWFTILFRSAYISGLGRTQAQMDAGPSALVASACQLIGFLVLAAGLAWLMQRTAMTTIVGGTQLALICWAAFFAAIVWPMYAYQAFPLSFLGIVAGGYLLAFLVTGAILAAWP